MIDRFRSIYSNESVLDPLNPQISSARPHHHEYSYNRDLVQRTNTHATKMREYIVKYKRNVGGREESQIIQRFKQEQQEFVKDRNMLKGQLDGLEHKKMKDTPEYNFMKKELLRAIKNEIDLQLELNQEVTRQKQQKQKLKQRLLKNSPLLANAIKDIQAKRADILYLQQQINQCIQLLQIIGILTNETGQKIDLISERVRNANQNIERAQANIDKAKIAMEKSRCRMCCIIVLALIAIIGVLIVLYGVDVIHF